MANDAKKQPIKFLFDQCQKSSSEVFLEVHGTDIDFAKSEQSYHLTSSCSKIAFATPQEVTYIRVILHCMHICEMALNPYLIRYLIP